MNNDLRPVDNHDRKIVFFREDTVPSRMRRIDERSELGVPSEIHRKNTPIPIVHRNGF